MPSSSAVPWDLLLGLMRSIARDELDRALALRREGPPPPPRPPSPGPDAARLLDLFAQKMREADQEAEPPAKRARLAPPSEQAEEREARS